MQISVSSEGSADLLSTDEGKYLVSAEQQERVSSLMAEAIQDAEPCEDRSEFEELNCDNGVEMFFFPDENQLRNISLNDKKLKKVAETSGTPTESSGVSRSSSEEWRFKPRRESESSNELRDILNFESNVLSMSYMGEDEATEALPQIREELGEVPCKVPNKEHDSRSRKSSFGYEDDFDIIGDEEKATIVSYCLLYRCYN